MIAANDNFSSFDNKKFASPLVNIPKSMYTEEGALPVLGNVGILIRDGVTDVNSFSRTRMAPESFRSDHYTQSNTCGNNCVMTEPEIYGDKDFGFDTTTYFEGNKQRSLNTGPKYTNAHGLNAFKNIRAGADGQSDQSGCYNFIPNISAGTNGACVMNPDPKYEQVKNWSLLGEYKNLVKTSFDKNFKL